MDRGGEEDWQRAKILADNFVYSQKHDRYYSGEQYAGCLRNAYQSGDLADKITKKVRLPGWWDYEQEKWFEDKYHVSSYTGNLAWVMIALLRYYEVKKGGVRLFSGAGRPQVATVFCQLVAGGDVCGEVKGQESKDCRVIW